MMLKTIKYYLGNKMTLTVEQTLKLVEKGVLIKNSSHLIINKLSVNDIDEYMIDKVYKSATSIKFKVIRVKDLSSAIIDCTQIKKIGDMSIEKILNAYEIGENSIEEIDIKTDVLNEVIGKKSAIIDGFELKEGMKFIFENDVTPKYCNRVLKVKFVNGLIQLVANRGRPKKFVNKTL